MYQYANLFHALFLGPAYLVMIYTVVNGAEGNGRLISICFCAAMVYFNTMLFCAQLTDPKNPPHDRVMYLASNAIYLIAPALFLRRLWPDHPFTTEKSKSR
jgi:hypothetical protein